MNFVPTLSRERDRQNDEAEACGNASAFSEAGPRTAEPPRTARSIGSDPSFLDALVWPLINAMREQLLRSGELLACLKEQPTGEPPPDEQLGRMEAAVDERLRHIQAAEAERMARQTLLALVLRWPEGTPLSEILTRLPAEYAPMMASLAQENAKVAKRIQTALEGKHARLSRWHSLTRRRRGLALQTQDTSR